MESSIEFKFKCALESDGTFKQQGTTQYIDVYVGGQLFDSIQMDVNSSFGDVKAKICEFLKSIEVEN